MSVRSFNTVDRLYSTKNITRIKTLIPWQLNSPLDYFCDSKNLQDFIYIQINTAQELKKSIFWNFSLSVCILWNCFLGVSEKNAHFSTTNDNEVKYCENIYSQSFFGKPCIKYFLNSAMVPRWNSRMEIQALLCWAHQIF